MKAALIRYFPAVSAIFLILMTGTVLCQTPGTGAISGVVYDPAKRVIANAEVVAVNEATHASRSVQTSTEGAFRVPLLLPGNYSVTVKAAGFAERTTHGVQVTVSEISSLNLTLTIAAAGASVQVTSDAQMAQLESSTLGGVVDEEAIQALPLSNRNYTQILGLAPGVSVSLPDAAELGRGTQNVSANGAKTVANNIQFNGIDANNLSQNSAANDGEEVGTGIPSPDTIQEFKVQTANYDAAYGRGTGANVDLVSKSGTNRLHGSAWEFLRNNIFNANDFFVKNEGQARPTLKQNQFGATVGGPILRDRTFFFVAFQGLTSVNGLGGKSTALLPLLTDDRSAATLGAQFCPANHLNNAGQPSAGYMTHAGGTQVACDGSNINPVALAILNTKLASGQFAVPNPQVSLPVNDPDQLPVGQSTFAIPAHYSEQQFTVDLDHTLNKKNSLAERLFYSRAPTTKAFSPSAANVPGWGTSELDRNTMFVLADTHTFNPNLVNVARIGYMRFDGLARVQNPVLATSVGEGSPTGVVGPATSAPGLTIDGLFTIGDAGTPAQWQVTNSYIYQDTVSWTRGRHNLRYGAEAKRHQVDVNAPFTSDGLLDIRTFDDFLLGQSSAQNGSPNGFSNVTQSTGGSGIFRRDERYTDLAFFAQDDIKLTQRLTVNAGLRYEFLGAPSDTHGRLANFDPSIADASVPATGSYSGFIVPANFPGAFPSGVVKSSTAGLWKTPRADFSPRVGFALQLTQRPMIVLRGGYGIYYDRHSGDYAESTLGQQPFSTLQILSDSTNAGATLQSPFTPLLPSTASYPIFMSRVPGGFPFLEGLSPRTTDPYTQEYNLNVQYAFGSDYLLEVGYVGTHSQHRPGSIEFNQALLASPQNPINGETTNSTNNLVQRLPFEGVSPGSLNSVSEFIANYNSLQSSITKRFRHGFQFQGSYTWAKSLDETSGTGGGIVFELWLLSNDQNNPRQAYGLTDFDRAQRGVLNFTWQSPKFGMAPRMVRSALSNWQFSGVGVIQSGTPITVLDGNAGSVYGNFENRAQRTGSSPSTHGSLFSRVTGHYLDAAAFTRAPEAPNGTSLADQDFGNSGVGIVRGPGQHNIDMAVERVFPITESSSVRFRAESFNLTNTPQFANPSNSLGYGDPTAINPTASASFGQITSLATNPRIIQFALKFIF
jgi:hypothetical protein